uniref:Meiosis-specific nuclear structural protein 1 n=1 Tax=Pyramimonas obovata TaxID=1411642 RepID=A0A7S0N9X8_9CHLO|mmetsp:Transcript_22673/g.49665  ORF Transcript_22673/g.49665 Transcript_22673/m.49665 type:complete len:493 (+) Transcript_22673:125-1603(+)
MAAIRNRPGSLGRAQEAREAKRRVDEYQLQGLLKYAEGNKMLVANSKVEERSEHTRREREARGRLREEMQMEGMYENHKQREYAQYVATEEAMISAALEKTHKADERSQREVQRIRNQSEELRWLQEKIRTAEVQMMRQLQLDEKQLIDHRKKQENEAYDDMLEANRQKAIADEDAKEARRRENQVGARYVLMEQMEEKLEQQRAAKKEFERERAAVDQIVSKIHEEDEMELLRKKSKQEETKKWVDNFMVEREQQREAQRNAEWEEEQRIREFNEEVAARKAAQAAVKKAKDDEAARILARIGKEKEEEMRRKEEMEELINRLYFEEEEKRHREKEAAKAEKQARMVEEMKQGNEFQKMLKAQRRIVELEEEERNRKIQMAKYAEDEQREKEAERRRKQKMLEFKAEVKELAAYKRGEYEKQKAREVAEFEAAAAQERREQDIVEQERQRMLREHAESLMAFLPKGVLRKPEDLDMLVGLLNEKMGQMGRD